MVTINPCRVWKEIALLTIELVEPTAGHDKRPPPQFFFAIFIDDLFHSKG
jgi:hypothetical protein